MLSHQAAVRRIRSSMARKIILDVDPGIDDAVALCLALEDPSLDVLAVTATGGTVSPEQSTLERAGDRRAARSAALAPAWAAPPNDQMLRADGRHLFGANGLCGAHFAVAKRHHQHSSVKVICDEVRAAPGDVTIVATGPLTNIASALQQQPDLASLIGHLIMIGGTLAGPGNVTAAAEFNIYCDAEAARAVFHSQVTKTLIPIDLTSRMLMSFDLLGEDSRTATRAAASCCSESCPVRFAHIASNWASRAFICTTRWRSWPRSSRICSPPSACTATWKPTARSPTAPRCSIAVAIRRAGRTWTWPSIWIRLP